LGELTLRREPLVTRAFVLLVIAHFLQALGYTSMLLLPLYVGHLGASRAEIGTIMATAAIGGLLLRPVAGWALDAIGRKPTLLVGTIILVVGTALVAAVDQIGALLYVGRFLIGVGSGTLFTAYFTLAADIIPESRRTEGIALFGISGLAPLAFNGVIASLEIPVSDLPSVFSLVALLISASLLLLLRIPEPSRTARGESTAPVSHRMLLQKRLQPVWLATVVFSSLVACFMAFATVAAERRGMSQPATIWLTYAFGAVTVRLLGARLPDRVGTHNMVAPALATYVSACLLAAWAPSREWFLLAGLMGGIGHGYSFPVLTSQVVGRSPAVIRGAALAVFTALWDLTSLTLTPLLGAFADIFGDPPMFALVSCIATIGLALWAWYEHRVCLESLTPVD